MNTSLKIFQTVPRIIFNRGSIEELGEEAKRLAARRAAVITDIGVVQAGLVQNIESALDKAGIVFQVFDRVESDPKVEIAQEAADFCKEFQADLIVGVGGGSALDITKAAAVLCVHLEPILTYAGVGQVPGPCLPTILIPTTAGTGSEVTSISILSDTKDRMKRGVVSDFMFAKTAILDPELTRSLPPAVTASTGLDALVHAIESYVGRKSTFITEPLALEAIGLVGRYLRRAFANGGDMEAREGMLSASLLAGLAFSNTQTGAAHACGMALGAEFHIPHGVSTAIMLPAVMAFNSLACPEKFAAIARALGENIHGLSDRMAAKKSVEAALDLTADLGFAMGLENYGVSASHIPMLAQKAIGPAQRLWDNNPRTASEEDVQKLFEAAMGQNWRPGPAICPKQPARQPDESFFSGRPGRDFCLVSRKNDPRPLDKIKFLFSFASARIKIRKRHVPKKHGS